MDDDGRPASMRFELKSIRQFWPFARRAWRWGALGLGFTLVTAGLSSLVPLMGKVVIDFILLGKSTHAVAARLDGMGLGALAPAATRVLTSIHLLIFALAIGGAALGLLRMGSQLCMTRFQQEMTFDLESTLFARLLRFPLAFFKARASGYLLSRVTDDVHAIEFVFAQSISMLISSACRLAFGAAILLALSPTLALVVLATLPPSLYLNHRYGRALRRTSRDQREAYARTTGQIEEVLSGIEVVKTFSAEGREAGKVTASLRELVRLRMQGARAVVASGSATSGFQFLSLLLLIWIGVRQAQAGAMSVGDYVSFIAYGGFLFGPVASLLQFRTALQPVLTSLERLEELLTTSLESDADPTASPSDLTRARGEIAMVDVSFGYADGPMVVQGVCVSAKPGETIAIVGPSGAGKTTLVNLLLRFYTPRSGQIFLDDHELRVLQAGWLRDQIGVVAQDVFLFNETIEDNIRYGDPGAPRQEVVAAAQRAGILPDIEAMPAGWKTMMGERGARLSTGQRQRIAIARAFLRNPPVLVLDEPTSALDADTERHLMASLRDLAIGRTTLLITHREHLKELAHRVYRLDAGCLTEIQRT